MRLWHVDLIHTLPRQQLLGQHQECCALRGLSWGVKHSTVDYVFKYSPMKLFAYHLKVMQEMADRGYHVDQDWTMAWYRGKQCDPWDYMEDDWDNYPEHDVHYYYKCIELLKARGAYV